MKKTLFLILVLAIVKTSYAYDFKVGELCYKITSNSEVEVTYQHLFSEENYQDVTSVTIPSTVTYADKTYTVTAIGDLAFYGCSSLESITIPNSIVRIGDSAFSDGCSSLESIVIPNSVRKIEDYAFYGCSSLASITMPNDVIIGHGAFHTTQWYENQPDGVLYLGNTLYYYKGEMQENTSIKVKDGTTSISAGAFENCYTLVNITIPSSVTHIGRHALHDTQWYQDLPDGLVYLNKVLYACKGEYTPENHVEIKDGTVSISGHAFDHCEDMRSITIPNTVTTIGENTFEYCYALESINIPNSVTTIGEGAFYDCTSLATATIGNGITNMDDRLFDGCTALNSVSFADGAKIIGNNAFCGCSNLHTVEMPNTITFIGEGAFSDCQALTEIEIPTGVKNLNNGIFAGCSALTEINIHNSLHTIGEGAFRGCQSLTDITIPNSVTTIGIEAFHDCSSLTTITIPEGIKKIEGDQFNGCPLNTVVWNAKNCSDFGDEYGFSMGSPFESRYDYITSFTFGENVEHIPAHLCNNLREVTSIVIPNKVTSIGDYAFYGCSGLTEITIPENVISIGYAAFQGCSFLSSVYWNAKECDTDGVDIFDWESNLNSFTLGKNAQKIPIIYGKNTATLKVENGNAKYDSRNNCNAIIETASGTLVVGCKSTIIPSDIAHIGKKAFYNNSSLETIAIPKNVKSIGEAAFQSCKVLKTIHISDGVESIGSEAFGNCISLKAISIPKSVSNIAPGAFTECPELGTIVIEEGNPVYDSRNNCNAIIETATNTLIQGCKSTIIPEGVEAIGMGAFVACENLFAITIPNSVETIAEYAFDFCENLVKVNIGQGVKHIGEGAFAECDKLTDITIPNSVETIADFAFCECESLTEVNIGSGINTIGEAAFAYCESLNTIRCYAETPPTCGEECFDDAYTATLFVLSKTLTDYSNHEEWGKFENIKALASEKVETDGVQVSPSTDEVTIIWPIDNNADTYTIVIKKGNEVVCTLSFNSEGMLLNIAFAPAADRSATPMTRASQTGNGLSFTVTGLENEEHYAYTITAKDSSNQIIQTYSGEFTTQKETGIKETQAAGLRLENGRVICDEESYIYDMTGRDVTSQNGNLHGVYIVRTKSESIKVKL